MVLPFYVLNANNDAVTVQCIRNVNNYVVIHGSVYTYRCGVKTFFNVAKTVRMRLGTNTMLCIQVSVFI